ncbi:MAG: hypothetical protein ED557_06260 [Balneola sp.]|nr:MAG: hypothetical protein ED557_06260 [Balneola sp.]
MNLAEYYDLKKQIIEIGFKSDLDYIESCLQNPCSSSDEFAYEYIWVVLNSGLKYQVASKIYPKIIEALNLNIPVEYIFNHSGKVSGIDFVYKSRKRLFDSFLCVDDKISYLETLPWIGAVTKYHLARNLGINVCKPDRHLIRIANKFDTEPSILCQTLSDLSGDLVGIVDFVLWSCGNQRLL